MRPSSRPRGRPLGPRPGALSHSRPASSLRQPGGGGGFSEALPARPVGLGKAGALAPPLGGGRRGAAGARQATRASQPRSECPGARGSCRRQCGLVRAAPSRPGQDSRRGASEHGSQLSMMDLELPPPGLPSQQVLPPRPHSCTRMGAWARGSRGPGATAATGVSSRLWPEPGLQWPRTGVAASAPGRGGRAGTQGAAREVGGAAGWTHRPGARRPRRRVGGGLGDMPARVGRVRRLSLRPRPRGWDAGAPAGPPSLSGPMAAGQEGADAGGLSRRGPALPGLRRSPAWEPAKMCLVTGPLLGELRSPGWDPEPLLCRRCPRPHNSRALA